MFSDEELELLGINEVENRVLKALHERDFGVTGLSNKTKVKRTSLYPILERLKERGLVTYFKSGRRRRWVTISPPLLQEKLFSLAKEHRGISNDQEKEVGIIASQESAYKIYHGKKKLIQIYEDIAHLPRASRLYGIQPNASLASSVKNLPPDKLIEINNSIKKRQIIVESILQEDFLKSYRDIIEKKKDLNNDVLTSYGDRLAITTYISKDFLNFDAEIVIYDKFVAILNWQELIGIVIKNKEITGIMLELFKIIKTTGTRVEQKHLLKNLSWLLPWSIFGGFDEFAEEGVRIKRSRFKLGVELGTKEEGVDFFRELGNLH